VIHPYEYGSTWQPNKTEITLVVVKIVQGLHFADKLLLDECLRVEVQLQ